MFIGIDGTGPPDDKSYVAEMRHSFINILVKQCPDEHSKYFRGPSLTGTEVSTTAWGVTELIQRWVEAGDRKISLAGYSRGGAVAVVVAQNLKKYPWAKGLQVECMALFDAVDRDIRTDSEIIPDNVKYAYHARRNTMIGSRVYFSNCATKKASARTKYDEEWFVATHAALGGMPWTGDHPGDLMFMPATVVWKKGADDMAEFSQRFPVQAAGARKPVAAGRSAAGLKEKIEITETQENDGARQVRLWMWQRLQRHGIISKGFVSSA